LEQTSNLNIPPFAKWVKGVVHAQHMDLGNPKDLDVVLLCNKPSQVATHYTRMKTYGNHFRVEDSKKKLLQTYDSGITFVFEQQNVDARELGELSYEKKPVLKRKWQM
jgi:hypothetical protein